MRDAMCTDDHERAGLYFGARNGAVWGSADEGDTWRQLVSDLPDVMVVRAARRPAVTPGSRQPMSHFDIARSTTIQADAGPGARPHQRLPRVDGLVAVGGRRPGPAADLHGPGRRRRRALRLEGQPQGRVGQHGDHLVDAGRRSTSGSSFLKPWKATNDVTFTLVPAGDGTEVTWRMTGEQKGVAAVFSKVFSMDRLVGKDFEKGLARLKAAAEA